MIDLILKVIEHNFNNLFAIKLCFVHIRWKWKMIFLDLVPEESPVALKIDVEGYECKVSLCIFE